MWVYNLILCSINCIIKFDWICNIVIIFWVIVKICDKIVFYDLWCFYIFFFYFNFIGLKLYVSWILKEIFFIYRIYFFLYKDNLR